MSRKAKSPYQRHGKAPYRYSELYTLWRDAKKRGDEHAANEYGRKHYNRFVRFADSVPAPIDNVKIDPASSKADRQGRQLVDAMISMHRRRAA